jgi:hypothetical protein
MHKDIKNKSFYVGKTINKMTEVKTYMKRKLKTNTSTGLIYEINKNGGLDNYNIIELTQVESENDNETRIFIDFYQNFMDNFYDVIDTINIQNQTDNNIL